MQMPQNCPMAATYMMGANEQPQAMVCNQTQQPMRQPQQQQPQFMRSCINPQLTAYQQQQQMGNAMALGQQCPGNYQNQNQNNNMNGINNCG